MKIYKKKVKKHEEVWADVDDWGESKVKICLGNSNYGRLYVLYDDGENGFFLEEKETAEAFKLFAEIWETNKDNQPFGY